MIRYVKLKCDTCGDTIKVSRSLLRESPVDTRWECDNCKRNSAGEKLKDYHRKNIREQYNMILESLKLLPGLGASRDEKTRKQGKKILDRYRNMQEELEFVEKLDGGIIPDIFKK